MTNSVEATGVGAKGYSQVTLTHLGDGGSLIFVSGQVARDTDGKIVGEDDFSAQCEFVYQQIKDHLESVGSGMEHVLKVTVFLKDFDNYNALVDIRKRWFNPDRPPASTAVAVKDLVDPRLLVEIEAIATKA